MVGGGTRVATAMRRFAWGMAAFPLLAACAPGEPEDEGAKADEGASAQAAAADEPVVGYVTSAEFQKEVLESPLPVLVDFTATWCAPCKLVDPIVMSLMPEMDGRARVFKVDIDESPEIYEELRVNGVPTIIFFNNGKEEERIKSLQTRETYVEYLEAMIAGRAAAQVSQKLLAQDEFRRNFVVSRHPDAIESALAGRPELLTRPFENGQTPLSLILNTPSVQQNAKLALILAQDAAVAPHDLVGLGRCEEFAAAVEEDPALANHVDADGNSILITAMSRAHRLPDGGCLRAVLDGGFDVGKESEREPRLGRSAVLTDDSALFAELLAKGMNAAAADDQGRNALHWAAFYGKREHAAALLAHGADPALRDAKDETAADIARAIRERAEESLASGKYGDSEDAIAHANERIAEANAMLALLEGANAGDSAES